MNYRNLQLTFFDSLRSTEAEPYTNEETITYKERTLQEYVDIGVNDTSCFEIQNKSINFEDFRITINSRYISYGNGFTIELKVNGFTIQNSINLNDAGYSGTILIDRDKGFHYALIK